jgi:hypothetical protein
MGGPSLTSALSTLGVGFHDPIELGILPPGCPTLTSAFFEIRVGFHGPITLGIFRPLGGSRSSCTALFLYYQIREANREIEILHIRHEARKPPKSELRSKRG